MTGFHGLRAHELCHLGSAWMSDAALAVGVSTTGVGAPRLPNSHADRNESARTLPGRVITPPAPPIMPIQQRAGVSK